MLGENHNSQNSLKDTPSMPAPYEAEGFHVGSVNITYTKTDKLISALYMVTDIMDKDEPIRLKLRTLGNNIVSDMHSNLSNVGIKISEVMSFLDIAFSVGMISEMNSSILKKEFTELRQSLTEYYASKSFGGQATLSEFLLSPSISTVNPSTSIGVQKGSTLMYALKGLEGKTLKDTQMSNRTFTHMGGPIPVSDRKNMHHSNESFDLLKKTRREDIIKIIRLNLNGPSAQAGSTITDIKNSAQGSIISCGEKTLQRELVSMVKDGVLKKTGEKRWSRYFLLESRA